MRSKDVRTFDTGAYRESVEAMRSRGEEVHDAGRQHLQDTGALHPYVDVRQNRGSHNAMQAGEGGVAVLTNGIALPVLSMFDGTGSTARWLEDFFLAAERQYRLLDGARTRYNTQLATSVVQDVVDRTPVVQLTQFESNEASAAQVRLLVPAGNGGDLPEDYDLGLAALPFIYADIWTYYGLKGHTTLIADDKGRGFVSRDDVQKYLGQSLQVDRLDTPDLIRQVLEHWHLFVLQVPDGSGSLIPYSTRWWTEMLGQGRLIQVPEPRLLAEVRSALVYATEAVNPSKQGLVEFMRSDTEQTSLDARDLELVWRWINAAEAHFGAQTRLPSYNDIPRPGDKFRHYRHAWPIGHPRESENITPAE